MRFFGLVPAAGHGARFGAATPKQYLQLAGRTVIEHAVRAMLADARLEIVFVVLAAGDDAFAKLDFGAERVRVEPLYCGGGSRRESVHCGLIAASDVIDLDDWVLVHDAARACLAPGDLSALIDSLAADAVGGLLAQPLADTLKRADDASRVAATVSREHLWQAQTPQMFRHGTLLRALDAVRAMPADQAAAITDEASAIERLGLQPKLVAARSPNPKLTYPADVALAEALLAARGN